MSGVSLRNFSGGTGMECQYRDGRHTRIGKERCNSAAAASKGGPVAFITSIQLNAKAYRGDHVSLVLNYEPPFLDHHPCHLNTAERPTATRMIQPASVPN
jgi:hypothetical protein